MNDTHEVISAFLDDEPFNSSELAQALAEPEGRALLIDLLALRQVMQPGKEVMSFGQQRRTSGLRSILAVAAMLVALLGGYVLGQRQRAAAETEAPAPTRVVEAPAEWQPLP